MPSSHWHYAAGTYIFGWLPDYTKRIKFTVDSSKVDSALTHFPVTVILTEDDHPEVFAELGRNVAPSSKTFSFDDNLVAHYKLDETTGTSAVDSVSANNGTLTNMESADWFNSEIGRAVHIGPTNEYITCPAACCQLDGASFTISAWIRSRSSASQNYITKFGAGATDNAMFMGIANTTSYPAFGFYSDDVPGTTALELHTWYLLTGTYDATTNKQSLYVNGVLRSSDTATGDVTNTNSVALNIGKWSTNYTHADYSDVRVYSDVLTPDEISELYASTNNRHKIAFTKDDGVTRLYGDIERFGHGTLYPPTHTITNVKATSEYSTSYSPWFATDPSKNLIGSWSGNAWISANGSYTNQRFHIDLGEAKVVTRIHYENGHSDGSYSDRGANNFTFWGSNTSAGVFDDLVYANDTGWTQLTTSQSTFDQHVASNIPDPKFIDVTNTVAYRYYAVKIADTRLGSTYIVIRNITLQECQAVIHVSKSGWSLSSSADTDFYMYYDSDATDDTTYIGVPGSTPAESVWDSDYEAVYHMGSTLTDSTSNSVTATNNGTTSIDGDGSTSKARNFNHTSLQYINLGTTLSTVYEGTTDITVSAFVKYDSIQAQGALVSTHYPSTIQFALGTYSSNMAGIHSSGSWHKTPTTTVTTGTWMLETGTYDGANVKYWNNGVFKQLLAHTDNLPAANYWKIGRRWDLYAAADHFDGQMAEIRFSSTPRSAAWNKAEYNSLADTLLTYGAEEDRKESR